MRSVSPGRVGLLGVVVVLAGAMIGCSSSAQSEPWESTTGGGAHDGGGSAPGDDGGSTSEFDAGSSGDDATAEPDSGGPGHGGDDAGTGGDSASPPVDAGADTGTITSADGFGASRQACITKINALRATDTAVKLQPYTLENTDMINSCVDTQASNDESKNSAHYSFINNAPACKWGNASGWAQNECLQGYGTTPAGIEQCIQDMWDESLKPNCAGCVGCTQFGGKCPNCDYSGSMGYECGHYVNLSAPYFTMVACGFAGTSSDSWSVQNFE